MGDVTEQPITLRDLLIRHRDQTGDSYREIARRTGLSPAKIGQLMEPTPAWEPTPATLTKLAEGLGIPLTTLYAARAASMGQPVGEQARRTQIASLIVGHVDQLEQRDLEAVEAMLAALVQVRGRG